MKHLFLSIILLTLTIPVSASEKDSDFHIKRLEKSRLYSGRQMSDSIFEVAKVVSGYDNPERDTIFDNMLRWGSSTGDPRVEIYVLMSLAYYRVGKNAEMLTRAQSIAKERNLRRELAEIYLRQSYFYKNYELFDSTMIYALRARDLCTEIDDKAGLVAITLLLGDLYYHARIYDKAEELYFQVLEQKGDSIGFEKWLRITTINNLGLVDYARGNYSAAKGHFEESLSYRLSRPMTVTDSLSISYIYLQLAQCELAEGNPDKALEYYEKGYPISERYSLTDFLLDFSILRSRICLNKDDPEGAYENITGFFRSPYVSGETLHGMYQMSPERPTAIRNIYEIYFEIFTSMGQSDSALIYYKKYKELESFVDRKVSNAAYIQLLTEKEHNLMTVKLNREITYRRTFMLALAVVAFLMFLIFGYSVKLDRTRKTLLDHQKELQTLNMELEIKGKELAEANRDKDRFIAVLAHDLKNPFFAIKGLNELLDEALKNGDISEAAQYAAAIRLSSDNTYNLFVNLIDWVRVQSGRITFNPVGVNTKELINEAMISLSNQYSISKIKVINECSGSGKLDADPHMLLTIIRNLLSNAIKATPENGTVKIGCNSDEETVSLYFSDGGEGLSKKDITTIFYTQGEMGAEITSTTGGTGIGLVLVKDFLKYHNGKLKVTSEKGRGTIVEVVLPRSQA